MYAKGYGTTTLNDSNLQLTIPTHIFRLYTRSNGHAWFWCSALALHLQRLELHIPAGRGNQRTRGWQNGQQRQPDA